MRELRAAGRSWKAIHRLEQSGDYVQMFRSVLVRRSALDDPEVRARAISTVLPPGGAVCRESAAWLHGIDTRAPGLHLQPPALQCVVPAGVSRVRRSGQRCWVSDAPQDDVHVVRGVPATTPARTALDLARYAPRFLALAAVDAYAHQGHVDPPDLERRARLLAGARNIARARFVIEECEPATESAGESWLRLRLVEAELPRPQAQIRIRDAAGREVYRLDLGYPAVRVGVEYDGEAFHHATHAQLVADDRRRRDLARRFGWTVIGVHRGDVLGRRNDLERTVAGLIGFTGVLMARQQW
ncbi:type IV toxin-antitoxin system AbiEi family antitoxin domain-containing protein [Cellulomonas xiejunii]|uniref:type IV toxin-antitoxin system AbiEi family antitoxin domain-containing protein n=1 Tax=Cellulomonas xiejunii TaxID=2968083 RepID=UPI001D0DF291|nr:type IV toxin-antitoxin system AbiEi family antitoxin [Cellulomonas xiejunii]MCC2314707.1 type IV toxin-antitoxin system AbiEi family antitoxin [Cellulomonas xiejunii]